MGNRTPGLSDKHKMLPIMNKHDTLIDNCSSAQHTIDPVDQAAAPSETTDANIVTSTENEDEVLFMEAP